MRLMNVDVELVAWHLSDLDAHAICHARHPQLTGYDIIEAPRDEMQVEGILHVLNGSAAKEPSMLRQQADLLVIAQDENFDPKSIGTKTNAVILPTGTDLDELRAALDDFFEGIACFGDVATKILSEQQRSNLLRNYLDLASELLGNPCAVFDQAGSCVESSTWQHTESATWNAAVSGDLSSLDEREHSWLLDGLPDLAAAHPYPLVIEGGVGGRGAVMGVDVGGDSPFVLALHESEAPITPAQLPVIWYFGNFLSYYLRSRQRKNRLDDMRVILEDIGYGTERDPERIVRRVRNAGFELERGSLLAVFRSVTGSLPYSQTEAVRSTVSLALGGPTAVAGDDIITIVPPGKEQAIKHLVSESEPHPWQERIVAGISFEIDGADRLGVALRQARDALYWGMTFAPFFHIHTFGRILLCSLVNHLGPDASPYDFCDPTAMQMVRYDKEHGTHYSRTLNCYLINYKQANMAAKWLEVHPNTVLNRLNRIKELFDVDLDRSDKLYLIELTFGILAAIPGNEADRQVVSWEMPPSMRPPY
jgi:hypothetical protein